MLKKPEQPCGRDCARRKAGCAVGCPEWDKYILARNQYYVELHKLKEENNAARDRAIRRKICRMKEGFE